MKKFLISAIAVMGLAILPDMAHTAVVEVTPSTFTGDFRNGGDRETQARLLGNTSNHSLGFLQDNKIRVQLDTAGVHIYGDFDVNGVKVATVSVAIALDTTTLANAIIATGTVVDKIRIDTGTISALLVQLGIDSTTILNAHIATATVVDRIGINTGTLATMQFQIRTDTGTLATTTAGGFLAVANSTNALSSWIAEVSTGSPMVFNITVGTDPSQNCTYWSTDETAWWNASTLAVSMGGGVVRGRKGRWTFVNGATVPAGVTWQGDGDSTIIESAIKTQVVICSGTIDGIHFKFGTVEGIDGVIMMMSSGTLKNCKFTQGAGGSTYVRYVTMIDQPWLIRIENNVFDGIGMSQGDLTGVLFSSHSTTLIRNNLLTNIAVSGNRVGGIIVLVGIDGSTRKNMVLNNQILDCYGRIFNVHGTSGTIIRGNIITQNTGSVIWGWMNFSGAGTWLGDQTITNLVFSDNNYQCTLVPYSNQHLGYLAGPTKGLTITNNVFWSAGSGITLGGTCIGAYIHGNRHNLSALVSDSGSGTRMRDNVKFDGTVDTEN